ncbi:MAG: hypothetical protein P1V35_07555, partial [Planctomycetota bacterium]|nr:hypothetical protein [Planctomycetota bacterium]
MTEGFRGTLTGRVRLARRARLHARLGESLILGVAAALFLLCLALLSGSQGLERDAWAIAGIGALFMGVLWFHETGQAEFDWACRVDRSLGLNGRLLAALNVERQGEASPMGQLLIEGLSTRVTRKNLLQRAVPVSLWLLVLPFVGGSLLMQSLNSQRSEVVRWDRSAPQFRDLQDRLGEAQQRAQAMDVDAGVQAQIQSMREVARRGGVEMELGQGEPQVWASELEGMARDLASASQELRGDTQWDRAMDQAQALVASLQDRAGESQEPKTETSGAASPDPQPGSDGTSGPRSVSEGGRMAGTPEAGASEGN